MSDKEEKEIVPKSGPGSPIKNGVLDTIPTEPSMINMPVESLVPVPQWRVEFAPSKFTVLVEAVNEERAVVTARNALAQLASGDVSVTPV